MEPCPLDSTTLSRSHQVGSAGLNLRWRVYKAVAISAMPSGTPWCPSWARVMASMDKNRMAWAIVCWGCELMGAWVRRQKRPVGGCCKGFGRDFCGAAT